MTSVAPEARSYSPILLTLLLLCLGVPMDSTTTLAQCFWGWAHLGLNWQACSIFSSTADSPFFMQKKGTSCSSCSDPISP